MKKSLFFFLLLLGGAMFPGNQLHAQWQEIRGYVRAADSGEPIIQARVAAPDLRIGALTNDAGFFSLSIPAEDSIQIRVSSLGYETQTLYLDKKKEALWEIFLQGASLDTVSIEASMEVPTIGTLSIPAGQIRQMPALLGEVDVLKAFQLMPGVQGGTEGSAGLYVRGGTPDQNLILLDDVPLYYVNHLGGFVSLFDPDALSHVELIKGNFPARYGGRLASVVDLRMKEGNKRDWKQQLVLGSLSAKYLVEGPIRRDTSSLLVSVRFSTLGPATWLASQLAQTEGKTSGYYGFGDAYLKYSRRINENNHFYVSGYGGRDQFGLRSKWQRNSPDQTETTTSTGGFGWGNAMLALRWQHLYRKRSFHHLTVAVTDFFYRVNTDSDTRLNTPLASTRSQSSFALQSGIRDLIVRFDVETHPLPRHLLKWGGGFTRHQFRTGSIALEDRVSNQAARDTTLGGELLGGWEGYAYVQDEFPLGSRLWLQLGLHSSGYLTEGGRYGSIQPRVQMRWQLSQRQQLTLAYSEMQQYLHLLTRSQLGLPSDLWVPVTDRVGPQAARQASVGWTLELPDWKSGLTVEAYYKQMRGLVQYQGGLVSLAGGSDWQKLLTRGGTGTAYGLEFLLQRRQGRLSGWAAYTLAWNWRQFAELNAGDAFSPSTDRRHNLSLVGSYRLSDRIQFAANYVFMSGPPATLAQFRFPLADDFGVRPFGDDLLSAEYYGGINQQRLPAYHRLDLSVQFQRETPKGHRVWSLGLYNAYNQKNPFFYFFLNEPGQSQAELYQFTLFPVLPFVSYERRW